ncbi:hypothetical protein RRG08_009711 [Elysia crispata]|uniref:Uncharacterized protein n=1 Tax=Elysia crispata TaxID=231223 RepID=A0AAE1CLP1_9GAST|nr:hypothetical protein RRG08_009711 [Elysia crispata]
MGKTLFPSPEILTLSLSHEFSTLRASHPFALCLIFGCGASTLFVIYSAGHEAARYCTEIKFEALLMLAVEEKDTALGLQSLSILRGESDAVRVFLLYGNHNVAPRRYRRALELISITPTCVSSADSILRGDDSAIRDGLIL